VYQFIVLFTRLVDSLVVAIGSNTTSLEFDEFFSSLLLEAMRQKNMEGHSTNELFAIGCS
jgi:hypothetical protein